MATFLQKQSARSYASTWFGFAGFDEDARSQGGGEAPQAPDQDRRPPQGSLGRQHRGT